MSSRKPKSNLNKIVKEAKAFMTPELIDKTIIASKTTVEKDGVQKKLQANQDIFSEVIKNGIVRLLKNYIQTEEELNSVKTISKRIGNDLYMFIHKYAKSYQEGKGVFIDGKNIPDSFIRSSINQYYGQSYGSGLRLSNVIFPYQLYVDWERAFLAKNADDLIRVIKKYKTELITISKFMPEPVQVALLFIIENPATSVRSKKLALELLTYSPAYLFSNWMKKTMKGSGMKKKQVKKTIKKAEICPQRNEPMIIPASRPLISLTTSQYGDMYLKG